MKVSTLKKDLGVDFDQSSALEGYIGHLLRDRPEAKAEVMRIRDVYHSLLINRLKPKSGPPIPRIIHQIWLGDKPIPRAYEEYRRHWQRLHPQWEYRLWRDADIATLRLPSADLMQDTDCIGKRVDILRAELVHRYGGLYVDTDYDCFRPVDVLNDYYDFYGTLRVFPLFYLWWQDVFPSPVTICNSFFAAMPGHPVLAEYLRLVRQEWSLPHNNQLLPEEMRFYRLLADTDRLSRHKSTLLVTYLTFYRAWLNQSGRDGRRDIIFPPSVFNPVDSWWFRGRFLMPRFWTSAISFFLRHPGGKLNEFDGVGDQAFTHHDSNALWQKSKAPWQ